MHTLLRYTGAFTKKANPLNFISQYNFVGVIKLYFHILMTCTELTV